MFRGIVTCALATVLALSAGGCATWETLTFSPDENSNKTKSQMAQLYYVDSSDGTKDEPGESDIDRLLRIMPEFWAGRD